MKKIGLIITAITLTGLIFIFMNSQDLKAKYIPPEDPAKTAEKFMHCLGYRNYLKAFHLMARHSRKVLGKHGIRWFHDIDDKLYTPLEMEYLYQTNAEGHRTVMFDELVGKYCKSIKIKATDLKKAKGELIKKETPNRAIIRVKIKNKSKILIMKKEFGKWKAAWYPYEKYLKQNK